MACGEGDVPAECIISMECMTSMEGVSGESVVDVEAANTTETEKGAENYAQCRICQEEDHVNNMESPCGCRGSLKYVHSKCIQRWCDHKGDTICEICHQTYQNGYHVNPLPQSHLIGTPVLDQFGIGSDPLDWTPAQVLVVRPTQGDSFQVARHVWVWSLARCLVGGLLSLILLAVMHGVTILRQLLLTAADDFDTNTLFADLLLIVVAACGLLLVKFYMRVGTLELQLHGRRWRLQGARGSLSHDITMLDV